MQKYLLYIKVAFYFIKLKREVHVEKHELLKLKCILFELYFLHKLN